MQKVASDKEKKDLLKEYISFIPTGYNFDNETAKKVFAVLYFYSHLNNHQPFTIGMRTIADDAMISTMTVSRNMNLLIEKYKYVVCQKGHLKVNSTYQILSPSTETSIVTSTETLNKNDMLQRGQMLQQNVTTKLIDDVTITYVDNEQVTEVGNEQMLQCVTEGSQKGEMLHNNNNKFNYNLKHKHKHSINSIKTKINSSNKHMRKNTKKEKAKTYALLSLLTSKIEVLSENQNKTTQVLEKFLTNAPQTPTVESEELKTLSDKVLQLEETVSKQSEKIEYLNSCLEKSRHAYKELKDEIAKSKNTNAYAPTLVGNSSIETKQSICLSATPSPSMVEREQTDSQYKQLISAFYSSKKSKNLTEASKHLKSLESLAQTGALNKHQLEQISNAKKFLEEDLRKSSTGKIKTYALDSQPWETEEYTEWCSQTKALWDKAICVSSITSIEDFRLLKEVIGRADEILANAQDLYHSKKKPELEAYRKFLSKFKLDHLSAKNYSGNLDKMKRLYTETCEKAKKACMSAQNGVGGTTAHTDTENRSEGLKSGKNGVISVETVTVTPQNKAEGVIFSPKKAVDIDSVEAELDNIMSNLQQGQTPNYDMNF